MLKRSLRLVGASILLWVGVGVHAEAPSPEQFDPLSSSALAAREPTPSHNDVIARVASDGRAPPATDPQELSATLSPRPEDSTLPIPEPPPPPLPRTSFDVPSHDLTGQAIRTMARRVARFRTFRAEIPGAVWTVDESASWSFRADLACHRALARAKVRVLPLERPLSTPVPSPVVLAGPVEGVQFHSLQPERQIEISCELAARLPALARILKAHGVRNVSVNSSYREAPRSSFHTFGLALDIAAVRTNHEVLSVLRHFEVTPDARTCEAKPVTPQGQKLSALACDLAASHLFSSVLTPNYNSGHRDHFHLDMRPDDPRFFVR